jgi:hypothetical protein
MLYFLAQRDGVASARQSGHRGLDAWKASEAAGAVKS